LLDNPIEVRSEDHKNMLGFSIELYAYLLFANTLTPYGVVQERTLPYDAFVLSLEGLCQYRTFGTMFAGAHDLFQLIPQLSLFHGMRLREQESGHVTQASVILSRQLSAEIAGWESPEQKHIELRPGTYERRVVGECYRQALEMYLLTATAGSAVELLRTTDRIQVLIVAVLDSTEQLVDSPYGAGLLWPLVVAASCMTDPEQQNRIERRLHCSRYQMRHIQQAANLLRLLWNEDDPRAFGPFGLSLVMKKYNMSCCLL
jgi:hypothetical protein